MSRMSRLAVSSLALALSLESCSRTTATAPGGGSADARGTPITGENAFDTSTKLTWSPLTNEVIGSAMAGGTLGGPGLAAVRTIDGSVRILDPSLALFPLVSPDGQQVFYDAVTADSTLLRRRGLGNGGVTTRIAAEGGLSAFTFALSGDGLYLAYSGPGLDPLEPDTLRILNTSNGQRPAFTPSSPVVFSPDDGTLLTISKGGGLVALPLAGGAGTPVDFALPGGAGVGGVHWDGQGLHEMFTLNGAELWESTIGGGQVRLFIASENIVASSITWTPDGSRVAFWTSALADGGADTAYRLYVVSLAARAGGVVAIGHTVAGAITWSSDGTRLAYLFGGRLFTVSVVAAGSAQHAD